MNANDVLNDLKYIRAMIDTIIRLLEARPQKADIMEDVCKMVHDGEEPPCSNQSTSCNWSGLRVCDFDKLLDKYLPNTIWDVWED